MKRAHAYTLLGALATLPVLAAQQQPPTSGPERVAASFKAFSGHVKTRADSKNFYVESDGMPDHPMMVGITAWQQQVPLPQRYTGNNSWQFPLKPVPAAQPLSAKNHFFRGAIAIAANGIPIFNALNNRGVDSNLAGELDEFGGHCGRADDYHYHVAPTHLEKTVGKGKPIAFALDGYPLYSFTEPDGTPVTGLDAFNGHTTAALGYHYHATKSYPYLNGGFHGEVTEIEGQVDPQPRAQSPRPATPPLPGAKITGFTTPSADHYELTYQIQGQTCKIQYRKESDGSYTFDYITPSGQVFTRSYNGRQQGGGGGGRQQGGGGRGQQAKNPEIIPAKPTDFQLTSPLVVNGGALPIDFTCDGKSASPPVAWKNAPAGTKSFALVMHHYPPGETEEPHVYWLIYNIPLTTTSLSQNDTTTGARGSNTVNRRYQYAPPCSQGPGKKWYILTLYALSAEPTLELRAPVTRDTLLRTIKDKTLGTAVLNVSYERSGSNSPRR